MKCSEFQNLKLIYVVNFKLKVMDKKIYNFRELMCASMCTYVQARLLVLLLKYNKTLATTIYINFFFL